MVTIDNIVQTVGKFNGDISNHRTYERAKANVEVIDKDAGMQKLEETLKKEAGYNDFRLPKEPETYSITRGEITFNVRSETTTKRPQYKKAVEQMENYIGGINLLLLGDKVITGVAKEDGKWCIGVDNLLEQYEVIIAGVKSPGVKQTITYEADESIMKTPKEMNMSYFGNGKLNAENFTEYMQKDLLRGISQEYVKAYEKELKKQNKTGGIVTVNTRKGYKEESTKSEGADWAYVAKTLVNEDDDNLGELNMLASPNMTFENKTAKMPQYDLFIREPFGEKKLYVGIESIYNRIQELKDGKTITAEKITYVPKEIV
jgi:hypothetical protein